MVNAYPNEHYKVCVSTSDDVASFSTTLYEETIPSQGWFERIVDLSTYAGQTIYIAFVHYNATDGYYLGLDDFSVYVDNNDVVDDNCAVCSSGQILCYSVIGNTAKVTGGSNLSGNLIIPSSVTLNGVTYSVTDIGESAFEGCSGLTSVTIPGSITYIYSHAFKNCNNLTTVNYNATECHLRGYINVFEGCTSFTTLNIGENVIYMESLFNDCPTLAIINYNAINMNENCRFILQNSGDSGILVIGDNVRQIPGYLFSESLVSTVTIGRNVESIGTHAFSSCPNLTTVNYNATNCDIDYFAWVASEWYNTTITTVNIGDNVTNIPDRAFKDCRALTSLTIGNSVEHIGNEAFYWCLVLPSVTIPNSVTSIGEDAFNYSASIRSVRLGSGVRTIGARAFECEDPNTGTNCMQSVYYAGTLEQWCEITFESINSNPLALANNLYINNNLVTDLVIPSTISVIKDYAFYRARCLTSVTIPESVTSIGKSAFNYCSELTTVNFNATNCTTMGAYDYHVFRGCTSLATLNIGENVTNIPEYAFYSCNGLSGILTIPNSVTSIGYGAFYSCSGLSTVTIGNSVESIGSEAFGGCSGLASITSLATNPPIITSEYSFRDVNTTIPIYVPCGTVEAYNNAEYWSNFSNIQQDPDCPTGIEENEIADIELYPTTVTDILNITSSETISEIEIVNVMGQVVKKMEVNSDNAVCDVEELRSGVYVVRIHTEGTVISQRKFVKE